jgi:hypothetical protein
MAVQAEELTDKIRTSLAWVFQQLIEAELTARIGAARHERSETRTGQRRATTDAELHSPVTLVERSISCQPSPDLNRLHLSLRMPPRLARTGSSGTFAVHRWSRGALGWLSEGTRVMPTA